MRGIDLNAPITYKHASLRYFKENEYHVDRHCTCNVLLLVYEGVLRFSEDGIFYEIPAGKFHIQREGSIQRGEKSSDLPKYLYIHFYARWNEDDKTLSFQGDFDYNMLKPLIKKMDLYAHENFTYTERLSVFTEILTKLYQANSSETAANKIAEYLEFHYNEKITLEGLSEIFHFCKNQIINVFKKEYGQTPIEYLNHVKIQKANHLLEATSKSTEEISMLCGFNNYSHFYRLFMNKNGISPSQWRRNKRIEQ